ncbi:malonate decarboxylase subunit alpha [Clavibacter michiganensis]|uniref:Malonate decarboxylase subunit alpha n=3 Tax=Clavibacter michiganensis subsp. insidiosus TaxID=33014 RepID=A0A0D5CK20_9MICO|nr:malonate decarboxylase subunit alpha [Clavibacter michiganensis]AJW79612.1 malonate decarboxylase subunit alpha [Clavibacter michiganensis subsp. insidiosus]AWF97616.1 malonate decarboxylase subunit alpha [Clavibacter michiganensis subsp. insidiosus]AWG02184.1 malonate decarboxylase subunit alpha [Clavibacter michiganensis subsp. insidiosus]OQJ59344.1 malonate decarboxylase subunit alpha [Clavibacter michiganensis subsp. insidiosus]RII87384.1 malonate decarboxylase subunit alpha [Clavibacte
MTPENDPTRWQTRRLRKQERMSAAAPLADGMVVATEDAVRLLEAVIRPGDKVALEGDNQKQADFLSRALAEVDPGRVHELHMLISSISRPEHLDLFEKGIASNVDFAYAGAQSTRVATLLAEGTMKVGAIHTYLELYARLLVDLIPDIALVAADRADRNGNLYTGPNTEDTPTIVEATGFRSGIVIAQVNELVDDPADLPRVDIPGSWVDFVIVADRPFQVEPLFTRDPRKITDVHVLLAMLAIRGVYERHEVTSLNHGIGYDTAAIELLLPTYGESLGLRGRIARNWALNPHPTLIPAIEAGWVESISSFGGEVGMDRYVAARSDVFATGHDGSLRSNRALAQTAGLYATDMFIGSTLQIDPLGNSSTVTDGRLSGFGGAPNLGNDPRGRRHPTPAWLSLAEADGQLGVVRGRKLVVQIAETYGAGATPKFVEHLDAVGVGEKAGMPIAPVMIYGDDVTHVVSEEGVAYLYKARDLEERRQAVTALAGAGPVGSESTPAQRAQLRRDGILATPEDLGVRRTDANRSLLAAKSVEDLVTLSGGLYDPPAKFRSW